MEPTENGRPSLDSLSLAAGEGRKNQRRRSLDEGAGAGSAKEPLGNGGQPEEWLHEELEAVGELKRGAIAAQFPEEFSVDSDFLNGASNVWLPARLHPEIAPGEFQEWLKKHGSQLSKMEDTVNRRKSILSYSVTGDGDEPSSGDESRRGMRARGGSSAGVRRRNTTGLVRRKTFVERATEEEEAKALAGEDAAPFLVQNVQRSSLKRSKLANKRRDSTASAGGSRRRGGRRQAASSPLAHRGESSVAKEESAADRMSTAEILKQVTAAVDDFGFDDFKLGGFDGSSDEAAPEPGAHKQALAPIGRSRTQPAPSSAQQPPRPAPPGAHTQLGPGPSSGPTPPAAKSSTQPAAAAPPPPHVKPSTNATQPAPGSQQAQRKTITHKKSGSWWQWGRDEEPAQSPKATPPLPSSPMLGQQAASTHQQPADNTAAPASSLKAKLPSPISFLRFNRKSKKDRKNADGNGSHGPSANKQQQQQQSQRADQKRKPAGPAGPPPPPLQAQPPRSDGDSSSDASSDTDSTSGLGHRQPTALKPQPLSASRPGPQPAGDHAAIPSIITPVRPPPTRLANSSNRLPIHIERAIYRLASIKLANPRRPLLQQVLLSNMMFWYLELINPKTQPTQTSPGQPAQNQKPPSPSPSPSAPPQKQPQSPSPPPPLQQQQQQQQSSPKRQQPHQAQPQVQGHRQSGRRRSANSSEHVVMRSPQYERQQQQIYSGGGAYSPQQQQQQQQSPPSSPQSMQYYHQPQQIYHHPAATRSQPSVARSSQSDEDDDVPLALYRGERNAMSIG
ncbi:hypothetical protein GGF46_004886 [Coemansia sp. RSA 552]|nr:hypothetical protein GGF46_004886 [Coemansia sp. RSA 552]